MLALDELAAIQRDVDERLPPGWRAEVLGHRLIVNPPSGHSHNRLADRMYRLFLSRLPAHLDVAMLGEGVYQNTGVSEYMVPDVVVFQPGGIVQDRLIGRNVELVAEVVSPTNRREANYEFEIAERANRYGIPWALILDPEALTLHWWHDGQPIENGPDWAGVISWSVLNAEAPPRHC